MSLPTFLELFQRPEIDWFARALLHFLWQGAAIAALIFLANVILARASANLRYVASFAALLLMLVSVPATYAWLAAADADYAEVPSSGVVWVAASMESSQAVPGDEPSWDQSFASGGPDWYRWTPLAVALYAVGVVLMVLRLMVSYVAALRLRRSGRRLGDLQLRQRIRGASQKVGLKLEPQLLLCERLVVPVVVGMLKPAILIPAQLATGLTSAEFDAIMTHELAHVRRGDAWANVVQRLTESLLFYHPAVWYVSRVVTFEREKCCDDVVATNFTRETYASALVKLAEATLHESHKLQPVMALAASGSQPSQLKRRVLRLLGVRAGQGTDRPVASFCLVSLLVATALAFSVHAQNQSSTEESEATEQPAEVSGLATDDVVASPEGGDNVDPDPNDSTALSGPVRIEFVEDTGVMMMRGQKDDVDRLHQLLGKILPTSASNPEKLEALKLELKNGDESGKQDVRVMELVDGSKIHDVKIAVSSFAQGRNLTKELFDFRVLDAPERPSLVVRGSDEALSAVTRFLSRGGWHKLLVLKSYSLKRVRADAAAKTLERLFFVGATDTEEIGVLVKADEATNRVIIRATQDQHDAILELLSKLDAARSPGPIAASKRPPPSDDRPLLGVVFAPVNETLRAQLGLRQNHGVVVRSVLKGSEAESSGIEKHDVLLSYDNVRIHSENFVTVVAERAGKTCRLEFVRAGKRSWTAIKPKQYSVREADPVKLSLGKKLYSSHCAHCHGEAGRGDGKTAQFLSPRPRDFRSTAFLRQMTSPNADRHLSSVLRHGISGSAMPSFAMLPGKELSALSEYVEYLATTASLPKNPALRFPVEVERGMMHDRKLRLR